MHVCLLSQKSKLTLDSASSVAGRFVVKTNGLTLEPCLEMSGQLASVAKRATNRAKYPSSRTAPTAQRQNKQVETNKSNQRPPKISEAEQHQQRPRQPQQQHVRFSATSASASVVTKFRVPTPATLFCQWVRDPRSCYYNVITRTPRDPKTTYLFNIILRRMRNFPTPQGLDRAESAHTANQTTVSTYSSQRQEDKHQHHIEPPRSSQLSCTMYCARAAKTESGHKWVYGTLS